MEVKFDTLLQARACECGRIHRTDVRRVVMETGALEKLPEVIRGLGDFRSVVMICDENTYAVAGKRAETLFDFSRVIVLDPYDLHANERAVGMVEEQLPEGVELFVAIGSGTIHDITRYTAHHHDRDFVSVPTAASVDGYVSDVAAMTWRGAKNTMKARAPIAIVADIDIIAEAPMRLTASGVADMLGKYTALLDWKISRVLTGEYYCQHIVDLMERAVQSVRNGTAALESRDREAVTSLIYGLILSGIAMQHTGISRPASGAEHHISHFIETTMSLEECSALHGEKVGVGLILVSRLYHDFAALSDEEIARRVKDYTPASESFVRKNYGSLAEEIFRENAKDCALGVTREKFLAALPEIRELIATLPTPRELEEMLGACGACQTLEDIGLSEEAMLPKLYRVAPFVRNRLTLMRLMTCFER